MANTSIIPFVEVFKEFPSYYDLRMGIKHLPGTYLYLGLNR